MLLQGARASAEGAQRGPDRLDVQPAVSGLVSASQPSMPTPKCCLRRAMLDAAPL